jgi:hypothetical protein
MEELRQKLNNPKYLPSLAELGSVFPIVDTKVIFATGAEKDRQNERWERYVGDERFVKREIITREYVKKLGEYLIGRCAGYGGGSLLELGAGDGRLAHFLREHFLAAGQKRIEYQAVDDRSGARGLEESGGELPIFPVEEIDVAAALEKYSPRIVIVAWMPIGTDWTKQIRDTESVKEYVLIGHPYDEVCGRRWETWGIDKKHLHAGEAAPYEKDGFAMHELKDVSQDERSFIARSDHPSQTISFIRK